MERKICKKMKKRSKVSTFCTVAPSNKEQNTNCELNIKLE